MRHQGLSKSSGLSIGATNVRWGKWVVILCALFVVWSHSVSAHCPPDAYGPYCDLVCHCENNSCNTDATCANNTECVKGWYSETCQKRCGSCKGDGSCSQYTGHCADGCLPGFSGLTCTMECLECSDANNCPDLKGSCFTGCDGVYRCKKSMSTAKPKSFSKYSMLVVNMATIAVVLLACLTTYICYKLTKNDEALAVDKHKPGFKRFKNFNVA